MTVGNTIFKDKCKEKKDFTFSFLLPTFSSFTANINIQVIVQVQLIKSSSVQLIVCEFHTAIDSQFSTNIP